MRSVLHLGRTLRLVWRISPGWTLATVALAVVQGVLPLAGLYMIQLIVNAVTEGIAAADKSAAFAEVAWLILIAGLIGLATALARSASTLVSEAQGLVITDHISDLIHSQSIAVDLEYYENSKYYDVLHRAQQEAPYRPTKIVNDLVMVGQSGITLIGVIGILFSIHWSVGLIIVAAALPSAYVRLRYSQRLYRWETARTDADRRAWYLHWLLTDGTYAKEVRLFDLGETFRGWFRELRRVLRGERLRITARRSFADLASQAVATIAVFGTFAYIAWRTLQGSITLGAMMMYYTAFNTGLNSLQSMLGGVAGLYEDNLFLTYYHEFMALDPKVVDPAAPRPVPRPMREGVVFEDVTFDYPDTTRTALADIDLHIRPGEVTALVGANGSGKTTIIKLLCRLYDPQRGRVTLDGVDLRDLAVTELRRGISVIFQDFAKYQLSARQNIWVGNVALPQDDPAIEEAAHAAGADAVITELGAGYESMLGKWFEDGEELSIGEWQRVALARAFVRDAEILVFDEPTSALDPVSEWQAFEHIRTLAKGRAVVLISHRFSTVRNADRIHIVEQGRIVESGTHDELMTLDGRYASMYEVQARAYQARDMQ
ncbi:MAG TPA: ABC transporter ATP-binding protein [Thermoleophilia bacterium]|nr:ABC transporter ATP-binding protein [Thermoleophilia bacterium]